MLSVEHCLRRAERYHLKMFLAEDRAVVARMIELARNYRRLADRARLYEALLVPTPQLSRQSENSGTHVSGLASKKS
jgi:hypothetical protein